MRVIIGGAGRVGIALAKAMANEKYDLVVVDNDSRAVANAQSLDCLVVNGNITSRETLLEAGITNASVFIAATPSDETNLIACSIAEHAHETKEGVDRLTSICRLRTTSYVNEYRAGHLLEWAKVDHVVNPLHGAILRLNAGLRSTELEEVIPFGGAIAPGKPPAKDGLAITIAPIIIPVSLIFSGISKASGADILFANESSISIPF